MSAMSMAIIADVPVVVIMAVSVVVSTTIIRIWSVIIDRAADRNADKDTRIRVGHRKQYYSQRSQYCNS